MERTRFSRTERCQVGKAEQRAADLVTKFYALAPREWSAMDYEVRTLAQLDPAEVDDSALAHVLCYGVTRQIDSRVVDEYDLFRICLQDHRILRHGRDASLDLPALLLYVLTHELVHVVRFGQRMQALDLPAPHRSAEEASVDRTTRTILRGADRRGMSAVLERFSVPVD